MTKILLLEDDISLIDGLEYSLKKNGFSIETVRTAGEALDRLRGVGCISQYDLLLLDVTLPDGTGFDVCEKVRGKTAGFRLSSSRHRTRRSVSYAGLTAAGMIISRNRLRLVSSVPGSAPCCGGQDLRNRRTRRTGLSLPAVWSWTSRQAA